VAAALEATAGTLFLIHSLGDFDSSDKPMLKKHSIEATVEPMQKELSAEHPSSS
jgi:hypothetical protein